MFFIVINSAQAFFSLLPKDRPMSPIFGWVRMHAICRIHSIYVCVSSVQRIFFSSNRVQDSESNIDKNRYSFLTKVGTLSKLLLASCIEPVNSKFLIFFNTSPIIIITRTYKIIQYFKWPIFIYLFAIKFDVDCGNAFIYLFKISTPILLNSYHQMRETSSHSSDRG